MTTPWVENLVVLQPAIKVSIGSDAQIWISNIETSVFSIDVPDNTEPVLGQKIARIQYAVPKAPSWIGRASGFLEVHSLTCPYVVCYVTSMFYQIGVSTKRCGLLVAYESNTSDPNTT